MSNPNKPELAYTLQPKQQQTQELKQAKRLAPIFFNLQHPTQEGGLDAIRLYEALSKHILKKDSKTTIMIIGESGSGKGTIAAQIYDVLTQVNKIPEKEIVVETLGGQMPEAQAKGQFPLNDRLGEITDSHFVHLTQLGAEKINSFHKQEGRTVAIGEFVSILPDPHEILDEKKPIQANPHRDMGTSILVQEMLRQQNDPNAALFIIAVGTNTATWEKARTVRLALAQAIENSDFTKAKRILDRNRIGLIEQDQPGNLSDAFLRSYLHSMGTPTTMDISRRIIDIYLYNNRGQLQGRYNNIVKVGVGDKPHSAGRKGGGTDDIIRAGKRLEKLQNPIEEDLYPPLLSGITRDQLQHAFLTGIIDGFVIHGLLSEENKQGRTLIAPNTILQRRIPVAWGKLIQRFTKPS